MREATAYAVYDALFTAYCSHSEAERNFLRFENPFQILILTILSAQTTDTIVNSVSRELFSKYPTPEALARAEVREVEEIIRKCGFYHAKARNIITTSQKLCSEFQGIVPRTMDELLTLPGVGRKTANIVLNHAFGIDVGIAVDTHVRRVAFRIGLTDSTDPGRIERDLMLKYPQSRWGIINYLFIRHGRTVCTARNPRCEACSIAGYCRYYRNLQNEQPDQK
jgi:endonuclease-3